MYPNFMRLISLSLILAVLYSPLVLAHEGDSTEVTEAPRILGVLDFPNSGSSAAQGAFEQGVLLLHSFEFEDSRAAFLQAQEIDPGFAMAIWGEAMTMNHPLWEYQDRETALQILAELPVDFASTTSKREQMYLAAVNILYGEGDKASRDVAYMLAMKELYETYPDDLDAAAFYGLSILGTAYVRDFKTYMKAAAILEEVFAAEPQHPGAAHYLIHSYDDQVHAPLGLRAARVYSKIAPGASHAQHMVSHIYTSLGMWDEVVEANIAAVQVSEESMLRAGKPVAQRSKHALHWLEYAYLQQGLFERASQTLTMMKQDLPVKTVRDQSGDYILLRGSWVCEVPLLDVDMPTIDSAGLGLFDRVNQSFTSGFGFIARGELELARAELAIMNRDIESAQVMTVEQGLHENELATSEDEYLLASIMSGSLNSLIMFHDGDQETALTLLRATVEAEYSRPLYYGPPHVAKPSGELLGEMLLVLNRPEEAQTEFEISLQHHTGRTRSLLGLARAAEAAGDISEAAKARQQIKTQWKGDLDALNESVYPWLQARSG